MRAESCTFTLIHGEACAGEFHTKLEVDDIIFGSQLPVGQCTLTKAGNLTTLFHHHVVLGSASLGNYCCGEVGQRHDQCVEFLGGLFELYLKGFTLLFELRGASFDNLSLITFALCEECAYLFCSGVLLCKVLIECLLLLFASVVECANLVDGCCGIHTFHCQAGNGELFVITNLL